MPDVKIGIPAMLICLEMAFFSVLHIWAYPWKVYDVNRSALVAAESGPSFSPDENSYKGGFFGIKAYLDAFNPWDIVKAVGRSFRWMAVGRRTRETDISYKAHRQGTALQDSVSSRPGKYQPLTEEDDPVWDPRAYGDGPGKPYAAAPARGDIGVVENFSQQPRHSHPYQYQDERTAMPGRIEEDSGFAPVPVGENSPPRYHQAELHEQDTAYHGTHAHAQEERYGDAEVYIAHHRPQESVGHDDRPQQRYRGPYGDADVDMPYPGP